MRFSDDFVNKLRQANRLEDVMSSYTVLKRSGRGLACVCPFHSEKTASCSVTPDKQLYHCFGCHAGGDVITFIMQIEGLEYYDAVKYLAERAGIPLPEMNDAKAAFAAEQRTRILEINRETANFYYKLLLSEAGAIGRAYLNERRLNAKTVKKYGIGYAPESWNALKNHLLSKGFSEQDMLAACVITRSAKSPQGNTFDFFRNRLIFPIVDLRGNVVAFGGRIIGDSKPKYLNTGETPVYQKGHHLYSWVFAKKSESTRLILTEGYMDTVALNQAGFENTAALLGTAMTPEQAHLLSNTITEVILSLDSDGAGQTATQRTINILNELGIRTKVLKLDGAKDPDEYIKKNGAERFRLLINNADDANTFRLTKCTEGCDLATEVGRLECSRKMIDFLIQLTNPLEREIYTSRAAALISIPVETLRSRVDAILADRSKKKKLRDKANFVSDVLPAEALDEKNPATLGTIRAEEGIIASLMSDASFASLIDLTFPRQYFVTEVNRKLCNILLQLISETSEFSIGLLNERLSLAEMSRLAEISSKYDEIPLTTDNLTAYMRALIDAAEQRLKINDAIESDEAMLRLQQELAKDVN